MVLSTVKGIDWGALVEDELVQRPPDMKTLKVTDVFKPTAIVCDIQRCEYKTRNQFECSTDNCKFCAKGNMSVTERKDMDHQILSHRCSGPVQNISTFQASASAIGVAIQGLKYYPRTGNYEERSHPIVYFLDPTPPTTEQQDQLNITSEYRKLIKQDLSITFLNCDTPANTAIKQVTSNGFKLKNNATICIKFTVSSTSANPLLDINNGNEYLGGKEMWFRGRRIGTGNQILEKGTVIEFTYSEADEVFHASNTIIDMSTVGWIDPNMIGSLLRGYKLVTDGVNSWYEKPYGQFSYQIL